MGTQQFNRYNLFYRLERHLLLHQRGVQPTGVDENSDTAKQYAKLPELPPLPARYNGVGIPKMWFLTDRTKKRSHRKSHGAASFQELAQIVSANWKTLDPESMAFVTSVSATLKAYVVANGLVLEGPNKPAKRKKKLNNTTTVNPTAAKKMRVDDGRNYLGGVLLNNNYPPSADMQPPNMDMAVVAAALGNYQAILKNSTSSSLAAAAAAAPRVNNNSSRTAKIRARADADQQNAVEDADSLESRSSNGGISRRYSRRVTDDTSPSPQGLTRSTSATDTAAAAKVDQSPMGRLLAVGSLALEHEVEKGEAAAAAAAAAARNKAREEQEERERQTRLLVQQELERRMALAQQVREIERELLIRQLQNQASMRFSHQAPSQQPVVHNGTDMSVMRMLENELARRRAAAGQNNTR